jgi:hypothetical protein
MVSMKKICLLMPYFGRWPKWMPLYLETCRHNSNIDWIFFTDCGNPGVDCNHTRFIPMTPKALKALILKKLGIQTQFINPVKVCDFRPAFGILFEDTIREYDFWGHGDIDVIYGNIRNFITPELTENYDIISCSSQHLAGHFTLYRNTQFINHLYLRISHFKKLCQWPWPLQVDETIFDQTVKKAAKQGELKLFLKNMMQHDVLVPPSLSKQWDLVWHQGKLTDCHSEQELMYFHFLLSKEKKDFTLPIMRNGSIFFSGNRIEPRKNTLIGKLRIYINTRVRRLLAHTFLGLYR